MDMQEGSHRFSGWQEWLEHTENIPQAAYAMKNDESLTLIGGNHEFYRLFAYGEQELRQRYDGRLSALLDSEPLKGLPTSPEFPVGPIEIKQHLSRHGADAWLATSLIVYPSDDGAVLCCVSTDVTDYEKNMRRLASLNAAVHIVAEQTRLDYLEYDFETGQADIRSALSILPISLAENGSACPNFVETLLSMGIVFPEYEPILRKAFQPSSLIETRSTYELQLQHKDRGTIWVKLNISLKECGRHAVSLWEDITQEKEAAHSYLNETQFYQAILSEKDAYGHLDVTEDKVTRVGGMWNLYNEIIDSITFSQLAREFIYKVVHPEDRKHYLEVMQRENFIQSLENGIDRLGCEFRRIVEQNKMVWMQLNVYLFRDPITSHVVGLLTIQNINERKQQELLLLHDSTIDQLTRVYNRRMAETMIRECLIRANPHELYAFVILDIDNFKEINDRLGHAGGDHALVQMSEFLNNFFRRGDIIGRFGGDEFIVFLPNVADQASVEKRMCEFFSQIHSHQETTISCSAGIALGQGFVAYEHLFHQADRALYSAKLAGKSQFLFYQDHLLAADKRQASVRLSSSVTAQSVPTLLESNHPFLLSDEEKEQSFDHLIGVIGDIAYLIDPANYDLICGNQAFYDRLGMSAPQCEGMKCYEAMHGRDTPCPFCSKANWSTDKFYLWRNMNTSLEQEFLIKNKLVTWRDREALLAIAVDISNDKSIVDSMDNSASETHSILSGVQHMTEAQSMTGVVDSALESIGNFFRANTVSFWQFNQRERKYTCPNVWSRNSNKDMFKTYIQAVDEWLKHCNWEQAIMVESPEAMLRHSYDMYLYMKEYSIRNQRWARIHEGHETLGFIVIDNSSSNFQNIAFLESFTVFIAGELHKRNLIESTIYAEQHDDLTDLLSRKSFERFITAYVPDEMTCMGVVMANLNNLKGINSSRGFQTGNYFIKLFADMLRQVFDGYYIYRLNGDEFLVIQPEVTRGDLENCVAMLEKQVAETAVFTVSIGHSWDDVENDLSILIEQATQAMKVNKKRHYDTLPTTVDMERRKMLNGLVLAIEKKEFEVFLQPKVEMLHGSVVGAEALIRYHHKEEGYILPGQFIDMLEKNNLIRYIDLFVFEEVCKQLEKWNHQGVALPVVSLNFSRITLLEQDILSYIETIIARYDVPKSQVEIEITESVTNMGKSILYQNARNLYQAGFSISLDDFGTKYTNLAILADLNFSILKVDKSLVSELGHGQNHELIMKNIISMCQDLGITVLAEGIETEEQASVLQKLHCDLGQGYLYGKPMPIEEFEEKYIHSQMN